MHKLQQPPLSDQRVPALEPAAPSPSLLTAAGPQGWRGAFAARGGGRLASEPGGDTSTVTAWQRGAMAHLAMLHIGESQSFPSQAGSDWHWQT